MRRTGTVAIVFSACLLAACQPKQNDAAMAACWAPESKEMANKLASSATLDQIVTEVRATGKAVTAADRARFEKQLKVTTSNFYVVSVDPTTGGAVCGAQVAMRFTRDHDADLEADGAMMEFAIRSSERGAKMYTIPNTLPFLQLVNRAGS